MSHTERLRRSPNAFRPLTGITPTVFDELLADLMPRYVQADTRRKTRANRRRKIGGGRKHALDLSDRLLMLISPRIYTTHVFLGFRFEVDDSAVGRSINPLQPLLVGIFRIPQRRIKLDPGEMRELFFDATEPPTRRPARGRRQYDSGEKLRHTLKDQVVVARRAKPPGPGRKRHERVDGWPGRAEWSGRPAEDRRGARHREDERLADHRGAISQPEAESLADPEEGGGLVQSDVCLGRGGGRAECAPRPKNYYGAVIPRHRAGLA